MAFGPRSRCGGLPKWLLPGTWTWHVGCYYPYRAADSVPGVRARDGSGHDLGAVLPADPDRPDHGRRGRSGGQPGRDQAGPDCTALPGPARRDRPAQETKGIVAPRSRAPHRPRRFGRYREPARHAQPATRDRDARADRGAQGARGRDRSREASRDRCAHGAARSATREGHGHVRPGAEEDRAARCRGRSARRSGRARSTSAGDRRDREATRERSRRPRCASRRARARRRPAQAQRSREGPDAVGRRSAAPQRAVVLGWQIKCARRGLTSFHRQRRGRRGRLDDWRQLQLGHVLDGVRDRGDVRAR